MEAIPSSLKKDDFIKYHWHDETGYGFVTEVHENGAFVKPTTPQGIRLLRRVSWYPDDTTFIEEINGESMF